MLCLTLGTLWPTLFALIKGSHDFGVNQIPHDLLWTMHILQYDTHLLLTSSVSAYGIWEVIATEAKITVDSRGSKSVVGMINLI